MAQSLPYLLSTWVPNLGHCVKAACQAVSQRIIIATAVAVLTLSPAVQAQVGLTSGVAQVTLLARRSPQGALSVGATRVVSRDGSVRETTATVRISANSGYWLAVRRSPAADARIWVRSIDGSFQELTRYTAVTVDRGAHTGGEQEREVQFRVQGPSSDRETPLPVFYDLIMSPTL